MSRTMQVQLCKRYTHTIVFMLGVRPFWRVTLLLEELLSELKSFVMQNPLFFLVGGPHHPHHQNSQKWPKWNVRAMLKKDASSIAISYKQLRTCSSKWALRQSNPQKSCDAGDDITQGGCSSSSGRSWSSGSHNCFVILTTTIFVYVAA